MKKIVIVLPAYNPCIKFLHLCRDLQTYLSKELILLTVDDGSNHQECNEFFQEIASFEHCSILRHSRNLGKGAALKTAFKQLSEQYANDPDFVGCVTADCDGQHPLEEILRTVKALSENPDQLILACRDFSAGDLPWKSRFGNRCTSFIFKYLLHCNIPDTQTGLRGIPRDFMSKCCSLKGNRFEMETEMLLLAIRLKYPIKTLSIPAIYFENNSATHFRPFKDAAAVYLAIIKHLGRNFCFFALTSLSAALLDIGIFTLLYCWCLPELPEFILGGKVFTSSLLIACIIARICSSLWNYFINSKLVFNDQYRKRNTAYTLLKYYLLAIFLLTASWALTDLIGDMFPERFIVLIKAFIDLLLFLVSYTVQRCIVFR